MVQLYVLQDANLTLNGSDSYIAEKNQTNQTIKQIVEQKAKLNQTKYSKTLVSCNLLIKFFNFIFYRIEIQLDMAEISIWLRKTKQTNFKGEKISLKMVEIGTNLK